MPPRWKASAELSYTDQTGNRLLRLLTGGFKASHLNEELFRLDLSVRSRYGESDEGVVARNHYGSLAFDLNPRQTWSPFVFVDAEHDRFKRLDARVSGGAGAKYTPLRSRDMGTEASVSLAVLVSHESLIATAADPIPRNRTRARWSMRVRGNHDLPSGVKLQHVSFYQPLLDEMADYLLRTETGARFSLTERLALSVVYELNRNAIPPEGVSPDDRILKTGIIFDF
ncbi:MAG: DUF481 domain-containing protein [Gemmatimonadetes bacterium]|nr:DUF481 domain-containing protein [Gemmatimonadota bacterium]